MKKILCAALILCLACPLMTGCTASYEKYTLSFYDTFDTMVTIIGFARDQATFDRVAGEARAMFDRLHRLYTQYMPYPGVNNVYLLNNEAAKAPVKVEGELFSLLKYCKEKQNALNLPVNIAMGAVLSLWHDSREMADYDPPSAALPPMDKLKKATTHTSIDDLILDDAQSTVYFADPYLKLDVGAVAKGYAAGLVADMLKKSDMPSFILSAGGNVVAGSKPLDGRLRWGVSVQDPDGAIYGDGESLDVLYFTDNCAVTSGDYQRYFTVDGVRYHHIISPDTLMPANNMRAVTVLAKDSAMADLLSTALFLMTPEEAIAYAESLADVEALIVCNDNAIVMTDGMSRYAKSQGATAK